MGNISIKNGGNIDESPGTGITGQMAHTWQNFVG